MTLFISLLSLDLQRKYANRIDILCCIKMTSEYKVKQVHGIQQSELIPDQRKTIFERFLLPILPTGLPAGVRRGGIFLNGRSPLI